MHTRKEILPAVAAIVFNQQGEVLLQRRKDVGKWGLISGHVEFGESVTDAILREIQEETDAQADIKRFIGIYSSPLSQTYHYTDRTVQYVTSYFEVRLLQDIQPGFSNEETAELRFFPQEAIPEELALVNPYWLEDALDTTAPPFMR
jgi:8-oxo-dGTP pyrophosphatase MutT (NUDIX family)